MHIASGLTLVRRNPAQTDIAAARPRRMVWLGRLSAPDRIEATRAKVWKILPGAMVVAGLVLLGALFPLVF